MSKNNDVMDGLKNILAAIDSVISSKEDNFKYDKTYRAKIISNDGNGSYTVAINGNNYKATYPDDTLVIGTVIRVKSPLNNFSDIYIEAIPGAGGQGSTNYETLTNKPSLNTTNTTSQTPTTETFIGTVNLHKVSKTGSYLDLLNLPIIPTKVSQLTNDSNFITKDVSNLTYYTLSSALSTVATTGKFSDLTNKPTTVSGYGITDAAVKDGTLQTNLNSDTLDGYHANQFAFNTQILPLYIRRDSDTMGSLITARPTVASGNYLTFTIPSSLGTLGSPLATVTRTVENATVISSSNGSDMNFYGVFNGNIDIEFAVRVMFSSDNITWTPLSTRQTFGTYSFSGNPQYSTLVNIPQSTILFDLVNGETNLTVGSKVKYEIYARYLNNAATFRMFCGVNMNSSDIFSTIRLNLQSTKINTNQLEDNSVTNAKLNSDVKVGSLANLNTTAKTSVTDAINEINLLAQSKATITLRTYSYSS